MKKGHNIYWYLILKLLLAFVTLMLAQLAFYAFNTRIFHGDGSGEWTGILMGNLRFGMATIGTFFAVYLFLMLLPFNVRTKKAYRCVAEAFYIIPMMLILIPRGANTAYYQYTYRLLSDEIFSYLGISGQMGSLAPHFATDYWYAWVVPLAIFILFLVINSKIRLRPIAAVKSPNLSNTLGWVVGMGLTVVMIRGGFGKMIGPDTAARYCQPKNTALVNNDAYNIFSTLLTPDLDTVSYMSESDALALFNPERHSGLTQGEAGRNIVLIVVESLGQEFMGCYNQNGIVTRTPFLDSLARYSALYDGRSNGKKSIEGITAINTGIPNLMNAPLTNSAYAGDSLTGLPASLKRHGYYCGFFHGTYNGVMNFDRTCARIGFDEYLGKNEYETEGIGTAGDYDGVWGIFDEPFMQYMVRRINTYAQPFFAEVFTVTSHHPYPIPSGQEDLYEEGEHPILKCVEYTDNAIRRFFDEARKQPWYNNTIFIITGDHSGHGIRREFNDYDGWYRIPVMVFDPCNPKGSRSPLIVQQTDLYPTILDYLGYGDEHILCFGKSAIMQPDKGWQIYYGNGYHCMVSNNADDPTRHDITIIQGQREIGSPDNIAFLKAVIQQYNNCVIHNKLLPQ